MAVCPNCGAFNNDGSKFCTSCGGAIPAAQPAPQAAPQAAAQPAPQAAPQASVEIPNPQNQYWQQPAQQQPVPVQQPQAIPIVPAQPVYQPAPAAPVAPAAPAAPVAPAQVGPVNYQNTASNPYYEPDRASHNPYAPAPVAPQPTYSYGAVAPAPANNGTGLLILGIVAVVLAWNVAIGGIIAGAIGCSQAKKLKLPDGSYPTGKAKVGAILSKVGLIIGIVTTIIAIIWCIVVVVGIIAGAGYALSH
jgi:hypothetical protein